jgi:hypothetical protein
VRMSKKLALACVSILALLQAAPALASLSLGFATTSPIASGSLVSLDAKSSGSVVTANLTNVNRLFGVVVPPSSASLSLSGNGSGQVQVATSGTAEVLVSTAGGAINVGDYITVSSVAGVGQKVGTDTTRVIGIAQSDFSGTGAGVTQTTVTDGSGNKTQVSIGQIPVMINLSTYTSTAGKQSYVVPNWLQNLSNTVAGKAVSPIRVIMAGLILVAALASVTVLLYSAVRNSIISIGRNPLSRTSVLRGLLEVVGVAAIIMAVAAGAMYIVVAR